MNKKQENYGVYSTREKIHYEHSLNVNLVDYQQ